MKGGGGNRPGARRQRPESRIARAAATGHRGGRGGRRKPLPMVSRCSLSTPQASGLDSRTQESVGRKITKAIFHARGVGHQGKSEPLCMICQTAEASKCLGRGLRCEPGTARWPPGAGVNVRLLSAAEASLGHPPHTARPDELVTRPWLDCPAPGRKPGCPEMSSGSPVPLSARGVVWGLRISLIRPSRPTLTAGPPVAPGAGQPLGHRARVPAPGQAPTAHLAPPPPPPAPASKSAQDVLLTYPFC